MLKSKSFVPVFIFALLFFADGAGTALAQPPPSAVLRGQVLISYPDRQRVPVADALVEIYCVTPSRSYSKSSNGISIPVAYFQRMESCVDQKVKTDSSGRFAVSVPPDFYTFIIAVSASGAGPSLLTHARAGERGYVVTLRPGDGKRFSEEEARAGTNGIRPKPDGEEGDAAGRRESKPESSPGAVIGDEVGSYFLAEKGETMIIEARDGKGDAAAEPSLILRLSNNETRVLRKAGNRRYRVLWYGSSSFMTFRADSENPKEMEMYLETPQGNYVLKRVKAAAAASASKPAAKDTDPPQINITSPQQNRGMKLSTQSSKVTVTGRATDASGVNDVLVQDAPARLDEQGNFSADVLLKMGDNRITVTAIDISGNRVSTDFTLRREAQAGTATAPVADGAPAAVEGAAPSLTSGRYYALVIGINDYKQLPRLKTAEGDAQAVASILRDRLGFEVNLLLNATRGQIVGALNKYRQELDASANLFIYYAGHGYFDKQVDKAYWLPVDAALSDNSNWISADDVTVNVKGIPARHVLIVSDSCYSGTIVRGINPDMSRPAGRDRYIQRMTEGRSRTLIASGGNEPVADGGEGGHSVFASALLRGLNQTDADAFTAEELFYSYIREAVSGRSEQTPEYNPLRNSGHESGDFVFLRKRQ